MPDKTEEIKTYQGIVHGEPCIIKVYPPQVSPEERYQLYLKTMSYSVDETFWVQSTKLKTGGLPRHRKILSEDIATHKEAFAEWYK